MKRELYGMVILVTLLLAGCGGGGSTPPPPSAEEPETSPPPTTTPVIRQTGWYLRTTVSATAPDGTPVIHNTGGVFGELESSSAGKDRHDIESYGTAILQIRLINDAIDPTKEYFSDYRHYDGTLKKEVWDFLVKNETGIDMKDSDFTLSLSNYVEVLQRDGDWDYIEREKSDNELLEHLTLIDMDHNESYPASELNNLTFSMDGVHTRRFRWILGEVGPEDFPSQNTNALPAKTTLFLPPPPESSNMNFGIPPL